MDPLARLLEDLRESLRILSLEPQVEAPPKAAAAALLIPVFILALTSNPAVLIAGLAASTTLYLAAALRLRVVGLSARLLLYPVALAAASAAPLILMGRTWQAAVFTMRVVAPAVYMMGATLTLGWRRIVQGLEELHAPKPLTRGMLMLAYYLPRFTGQLLAILMARRARTLRRPTRSQWWRLLASSTGELILRSQYTALMLHHAIEARTLGGRRAGALGPCRR